MPRFIFIRSFAGAVAVVLLSSCGGGSDGTPPLNSTAATSPVGTTGTGYPGYTFLASGGTPPFSWSEAGPLSPGLALGPSGQLSGAPAVAGTYPISLAVTDSSLPPLAAGTQVSLKIDDSPIVLVTSPRPPAGTVTYPHPGYGFTASGGSPYPWQASGALPRGLTLASDGTVSRSPAQAGAFSLSVTAMDSVQTPVSGPPLARQILINNPSALTFNAMPAPPAGTDGVPYGPFSFSATGGFQPLKWSTTLANCQRSESGYRRIPDRHANEHWIVKFTVTVTDSAATPVVSSLPFTIDIADSPSDGSGIRPPNFAVSNLHREDSLLVNGSLS